uniref:Uncharacterized protein n=1 Tax=Arundo donax TaxID=35708 RepID=A0A0A8YLQ7_ARUDO
MCEPLRVMRIQVQLLCYHQKWVRAIILTNVS